MPPKPKAETLALLKFLLSQGRAWVFTLKGEFCQSIFLLGSVKFIDGGKILLCKAKAVLIKEAIAAEKQDGSTVNVAIYQKAEIIKIIDAADELGIDESKVTMDARFREDLGADSLDAVEIIMQIEEEFGVEINEDVIQNMKVLGDIVKYIEENK